MENPKSKYNNIKLSSGYEMPILGLGTGLNTERKIIDNIKYAILEAGCKLIDTASLYKNEELIGEALEDLLTKKLIKREEIFITTKIWFSEVDEVEITLRKQLKKLRLDYVDLYLVHWPVGFENNKVKRSPVHKTWAQMENCSKKGLCRSIGVSNFNCQILLDMLAYAEIPPAINQIELQPYCSQRELVTFCQNWNIQVMGYCPLAQTPADIILTAMNKNLLEEPIIKNLAEKYGKTTGQIAINWGLSRGYCVLTKSTKDKRLTENFSSCNFEMEKNDIEKIFELNCNLRGCDPIKFEDFCFVPYFK